MVEATGRRGDSSVVPTIAELITAYRDRTGTPSYEVMARKVRDELQPNRLHQLHTTTPKTFASPRTMELLSELLEVPVATIVLSYASSLGIPVRDAAPELARRLPPGTDKLTARDRDAVVTVIKALVDARVAQAAVELLLGEQRDGDEEPPITGPEPATQHDYGLAARRGPSSGRAQREEQDAQAEAPDPQG